MKYREKNLNNINAEKAIKDMIIALRYKRGETSSIRELEGILCYIESHEVICSHIKNFRKYLEYLKKDGELSRPDEWEWFLQHFMVIIRGHLQNPFIKKWDEFDLNSSIIKVI